MDPISLIVAALIAGASTGLKDTATDAVKDAYNGLKGLLQRKFGSHPPVAQALAEVDQSPEAAGEALKVGLAGTGADQDVDLVRAAQALLAEHDPEGTAAGKYDVKIGSDVYAGRDAKVVTGVNVGGDAKGVVGVVHGNVEMKDF
jgi:hypothetical protein